VLRRRSVLPPPFLHSSSHPFSKYRYSAVLLALYTHECLSAQASTLILACVPSLSTNASKIKRLSSANLETDEYIIFPRERVSVQ
jgi:hypothetical protein